jgi:pyruvate/2-oxoglutarate dehydrogenase complex dihydrolipoamide dehydrogenase (E3) component
MQIDS